MKPFAYFDPESIDEVVRLLREKENCELIAGGTDLLVNIKKELSSPDALISLRKINELKNINKNAYVIRMSELDDFINMLKEQEN